MHSAIGNWIPELKAVVVQPGWLPCFSSTGILNTSCICAHVFHRSPEQFGFEGTSTIISFQTSTMGTFHSKGFAWWCFAWRFQTKSSLWSADKFLETPIYVADEIFQEHPEFSLVCFQSKWKTNWFWREQNKGSAVTSDNVTLLERMDWQQCWGELYDKNIHILECEALILKVPGPHSA